MTKFAKYTEVPAERTKAEIETTLRKYGADQFISGWKENVAAVGFRLHGRMIRFSIPMPDPRERRFTHDHLGRNRGKASQEAAVAQEERARWRALLLVIKAKLEAVESGVSLFEDEFLAHVVLPDGKTVGEFMKPQIERAYKNGDMPLQLEFKA